MPELPNSLEQAVAQAREATQCAIAAGYTRLQIEMLFPELKPMPVAEQLLLEQPLESWLPTPCKVFFADAGAGALARRDWPGASFEIYGMRELKAEVESKDKAFILIAPSPVDVSEVQRLCEAAGDRPFILFNARLEDSGTIGIGYAARKLRDSFLNTFEPCFYLRPLDQAALFRCYPSPWQVWIEEQGDYQLAAEVLDKPVGEALDQILMESNKTRKPKMGFLAELQRFIRALS
jgi:hypothetical protein